MLNIMRQEIQSSIDNGAIKEKVDRKGLQILPKIMKSTTVDFMGLMGVLN